MYTSPAASSDSPRRSRHKVIVETHLETAASVHRSPLNTLVYLIDKSADHHWRYSGSTVCS